MEKRIFVSRFKYSKEFVNHLKFLINDNFNYEQENYKGYYYLYLYSLLACDNDVVISRGHLPTMIITNNESVDGQEEILDYKKIAIILNLKSISEAKDFCDKLTSLGLLTCDGILVDIEMFYGEKFTKGKIKKGRFYYDEKLRIIHCNGKVFFKNDHGKPFFVYYDSLSDEDLKLAKLFAETQKKLKSYEIKSLFMWCKKT